MKDCDPGGWVDEALGRVDSGHACASSGTGGPALGGSWAASVWPQGHDAR